LLVFLITKLCTRKYHFGCYLLQLMQVLQSSYFCADAEFTFCFLFYLWRPKLWPLKPTIFLLICDEVSKKVRG
jgi:hypothetical protein